MFKISGIEFKRHITGIGVACLVFVVFVLVIHQIGIFKHQDNLKEVEEFVDIESLKVERYINYHQYAMFGFRILLRASPLSTFYGNSTTLDDLHLFIDNSTRLKPGKHERGKNLFDRPTGGVLDLSWFILVFGGFGFGLWCFFAYRNKEYMLTLMNFASKRNAHLGVILGRILLMIVFYLIIIVVTWLQYLVNGISLSLAEIGGLLIFLLVTVLTHALLMVMSSAFGAAKNWIKGAFLAGGFFALIVFIWPEALNEITYRVSKATMKSVYQLELQKIELMMKFERESWEYVNKFDTRAERVEADKVMGEKWWNTEFANMEKLEAQMKEKTRENSNKFHLWSAFNPATFYKSTNNELSSKGYNAYLDIYDDGTKKQKGFLRFFLDKKSFKPYTDVEPFLGKDEMVFDSKVSLPTYFILSLIISLCYIAGALFFSFSRFKEYLFPDMIVKNTEKLDMQLTKGKDTHIIVEKNSKQWFLNVLNGKVDKLDGKVEIDGKSIISKDKKDHFYFPDLEELPGNISVRSLAAIAEIPKTHFGKRLKHLDFMEKFKLNLQIAKSTKRKIYLFYLAWPIDLYEVLIEVKEDLKAFTNEETIVIYLGVAGYAPLGILKADKEKMLYLNREGKMKYGSAYKLDDDDTD
jgi:hypothetical protein